MARRIAFAYLWTFGPTLLFLPLAFLYPAAGHSLLYLIVGTVPARLLLALILDDHKQMIRIWASGLRIAIALLAFGGISEALGVLGPNNGYLALPFVAPPCCAFLSGVFFRGFRTKKWNARNQG